MIQFKESEGVQAQPQLRSTPPPYPSRPVDEPAPMPGGSAASPARPYPQSPYPPMQHPYLAGRGPRQAAPVARRSKADALRLAQRVKRGIAAGTILSFGALSLAVGSHVVTASSASATTTSGQSTSSSTQSSSGGSSQSSGSSSFSSSSSSPSSVPATSTGVS